MKILNSEQALWRRCVQIVSDRGRLSSRQVASILLANGEVMRTHAGKVARSAVERGARKDREGLDYARLGTELAVRGAVAYAVLKGALRKLGNGLYELPVVNQENSAPGA